MQPLLARRLASKFNAGSRGRGEEYYRRHRVQIRSGSASEVIARVQGTEWYEVRLKWGNDTLLASCECPYFMDNFLPCKHLWATILATDAQLYLSPAASAANLNFRLDGDDGDDLDMEAAEMEEDEAAIFLSPKWLAVTRAHAPGPPLWRINITNIANQEAAYATSGQWSPKQEILYVVDVAGSTSYGMLVLNLQSRSRRGNGNFTVARSLTIRRDQIGSLPNPADRQILSTLLGGYQYWSYGSNRVESSYHLPHELARTILPWAVSTGRCFLRVERQTSELFPLTWDDGKPWQFELELTRPSDGFVRVTGHFFREGERLDVTAPLLVTQGGLLFTRERIMRTAEGISHAWISHLRTSGPLKAPNQDHDELLNVLLCSPHIPALRLPEDLQYEKITVPPRPCLRIQQANRVGLGKLQAELFFDYKGHAFPAHETSSGFYDADSRRFFCRDKNAEAAALVLLDELGVKRPSSYWNAAPTQTLPASRLPRIVQALLQAGWHVEAEGKIFRRASGTRVSVSSGVDWFELQGEVGYGESVVKFPALLEALRRGDSMVLLDDGSYGILPEEWLRRFAPVVAMGTIHDGSLRFRGAQVALLDALLATQPEVHCDKIFARIREKLQDFRGVQPIDQPEGFVGELRGYQREGLGWMHFLQRFSFGGCLADDMGVGKTTQVLALLESRRTLRGKGAKIGPSLVVVPKSLIFNWKQEAERFTPSLRILDYAGNSRDAGDFEACDVVLTTYGTLRRDAPRLRDKQFDYVVLDEAQVVKNASTGSAKAIRLLHSDYRLALSGTPVENHLGELWALFDFLNPGMLGTTSAFKLAGTLMRNPDEDTRRLLAHALRPFFLRRTKEQVARELPSKTEQTIYCEMESTQRRLYDELRVHYRNALLKRTETMGLAKSKIQVLEALLRLRQAACHPGLLDPKRLDDTSAKLEVLISQLREILDEGHKALVFSQFTSFLRIVRDCLEQDGITYEYLDGQTHDRQQRVERFQNDPNCRLFLISLKAGGLGLNLTAAEYVFLLDPWWNPAVEAQAVDRAHRIGQDRQVFAYRLIARDTVEERVLELQKTKRSLADAIIGADNSLIRDLSREDLELLLS